jgi:hypothetical protein
MIQRREFITLLLALPEVRDRRPDAAGGALCRPHP